MEKKRKYAVIGDPVEHSLSPLIYEYLFRVKGEDIDYERIRVTPDTLEEFIRSIPERGLQGFNVTMPLKNAIEPYLATKDFEAYSGVNTVRVDPDGTLHGFSTDAEGLRRSLARHLVSFKGSRFVILGCGGAAVAIIESLLRNAPKSLTIVNRTPERAAAYADQPGVQVLRTVAEAQDALSECDVLINATPLGMQGCPDTFENYAFLDALPSHAVVADLIYAPPRTQLLTEAEARGHQTINGLMMLAGQGIASFQLYTGIPVHHDSLTDLTEALRAEVELNS